MGYMQASGMAEAVEEGRISLDQALVWHLQSNHYPPVSLAFLPAAMEAVQDAREGWFDRELTLPNGRVMGVGEVIRGLNLDAFV